MRLFVYEYATAQPRSACLPESVRREGRAMFDAVLEDARLLKPHIEVLTLPEHSALNTEHYFRQADYALIIAPEFDGILQRLARDAQEAGCKLLGPLPDAIRLTADKWELYRHWRERGVATPRTWLGETFAGGQKSESWSKLLVKHRWGAGSLGVTWWNPGEPVPDQHIVQQYVEGTPVSVALMISPSGKIMPWLPAHQHISNDGQFNYLGGSFLLDDRLCHRVINLATKAVQGIIGLQGYVGVDAILGMAENGKEDMVLEINPRVTTSYLGLRQATSNNLINIMLEILTCDRVVPNKWSLEEVNWVS